MAEEANSGGIIDQIFSGLVMLNVELDVLTDLALKRRVSSTQSQRFPSDWP
jgi:hypothetical protein